MTIIGEDEEENSFENWELCCFDKILFSWQPKYCKTCITTL